MLMVSTLVTRAQSKVFFCVADLASEIQKEMNVPTEVCECSAEGTALVSFNVKEDGTLNVEELWSKNLSEKSMSEVRRELEDFWEKGVRYEGDERRFAIKMYFKTW